MAMPVPNLQSFELDLLVLIGKDSSRDTYWTDRVQHCLVMNLLEIKASLAITRMLIRAKHITARVAPEGCRKVGISTNLAYDPAYGNRTEQDLGKAGRPDCTCEIELKSLLQDII